MKHRSLLIKRKLLPCVVLACYGAAHAGPVDIASAPLATSSSTEVKPNLMFILDDSGSMNWNYLPDAAGDFAYIDSRTGDFISYKTYGFRSSHCNGAYYNPAVKYTPPVTAAGDSYGDASFTAAWNDGYDHSQGTKDLTGSIYYQYLGKQPDHAFTYDSSNQVDQNAAFYRECLTTDDGEYVLTTDGGGNGHGRGWGWGNRGGGGGTPTWSWVDGRNDYFKKIVVSDKSGQGGADERTNFANWYSYYRTRILMMKTGVGLAFKSIGNRYRIGYSTISYAGVDSSDPKFLKITDFDDTQKATWYQKLYGTKAKGSTPLRAALAKAGRIYAGQLLTGADDPVQYSCQQNFTILSTDGYWNTGSESSAYGPLNIKGDAKVGDQDGKLARPMLDALKQANTLADVAAYYYQTDLRTDELGNCDGSVDKQKVCKNNVTGSGDDVNSQQHMTTFTLGLGVSGTLAYSPNYKSGGSADYNAILQGTKNWPALDRQYDRWGNPVYENDGTPVLAGDGPTAVDDLWHAAVNGHGTYFSAQDPKSLASGLADTLASVKARNGSSAAAATSNLEPVEGDNYVYVALYTTVHWDGNLQAKTIDPATGKISSTPVWDAQSKLDGMVSASSDKRTIYTFDTDGKNASKLKSFTWKSLNTTEQAYFSNVCTQSSPLSQCPDLTATQKDAASGENLVNFLRGQTGNEDRAGGTSPLYRMREHVLGDIVGSQPVYVKKPPFAYVDAGYSDFRDKVQKDRSAIVYVAANDGMLHAFSGDDGSETWAYIPPMVLPNLYKLADKAYSGNHQYFVDGSPTVGDVCPGAPSSTCAGKDWRTILVGGLNAGGRGYYALDVTDPANPKALWNFTASDDADLGYSFGNPIITKRKDGTWVVVFTSGYNNVSPGDGKNHLYVLNAYTGKRLEKIDATIDDKTPASGLAKINAWVDSTADNTAWRFYGGDLQGNVWRFDIDDIVPPAGKEATLLAQVGQVDVGTQPITIKPELAEIIAGGKKHAVVYVATGRYLGKSDLGDTSKQSIYALKDDLTATGLGLVRKDGVLVKQTLSSLSSSDGRVLRTTSTNSVDWAKQSGWYVDLDPDGDSQGERVTVDMQQQLGLLTVASNVPATDACTLGGYSWLYSFDYKTGQFVPTAADKAVGQRLSSNALSAGIKTIQLTTGKTTTIVTTTGGNIDDYNDPSSASGSAAGGKRISWRELAD